MRRQNSLAIRQPSNQVKTLSKFKKSKNRPQAERKMEPQYLRTQQIENRHKNEGILPLEIIADRIVKKINVISTVVNKMLTKEDKKIYNRLTEAIIGEQKLKIELANAEKMRDHVKTQQMAKLIERACKVQVEIAETYTPKENLLAQINSTKTIITKEYSPRYENLSYGMFDKRYMDENREKEKQNKRNYTDSNQNSNSLFKMFEYMEDLSQKVNVKVDDCKSWNSLLKKTSTEIEDLKKTNKEIQKVNRRLMEQDMEIQNLQKQSNFIDSLTKDLNIATEEKSFIEKKYKELEQEFEVLVRQKLHVQAELTKKGRQFKSLQQKYKSKLYNYRQELQILRSDISSQRSIDQVISFKISEDFEVFKVQFMTMVQSLKEQYDSIIDKLKENSQQLRRMLEDKEIQQMDYQSQIELVKAEHQELQKRLKDEKENNFYIISQMQNQKKSIRISSLSIFSELNCIIQPETRRIATMKLQFMENVHVLPRKIETISYQMQTDPKFHRLQTLRTNSINDQLIKSRNLQLSPQLQEFFFQITQKRETDTQTSVQIKQLTDLATQTLEDETIEVKIQVQSNLMNTMTQTDLVSVVIMSDANQQTQPSELNIIQVLSFKQQSLISKQSIETATILPVLTISSNINQFEYHPTVVQKHLQSISRIQNDKNLDYYIPKSPPYCQSIQYCHSSHGKSNPTPKQPKQPNDILALLLQAEQCLIVPEITVLREQLHLLRKQMSCLRSRGKQQQKQREEQNIFQFCL